MSAHNRIAITVLAPFLLSTRVLAHGDDAHTQGVNAIRAADQIGPANDPLAAWISSDPSLQEERLELAHYVVQCAMAPGDDRSVNVDGKTQMFRGVFGLLPSWTSGNAMTDFENRLLAACLGAPVNPVGAHVP